MKNAPVMGRIKVLFLSDFSYLGQGEPTCISVSIYIMPKTMHISLTHSLYIV